MTTKVLVVEDEGVVALDITQELESAGYSVVGHVISGEAAVAKSGELRPDVILMDIHLQGELDGIAAAEQISTRYNIPVSYTHLTLPTKRIV